ncbi:MAG: isocitrate/isopropylmalate family dehydrogenase, partial [Rhodococcus fascians]
DLAGELSGSLGMAPSVNTSENKVMAQAAHGSAPDIAGTNRANPTALFLSAAMLLECLATRHGDTRLAHAAGRIRHAVDGALESGVATADLGGTASTGEFTETVLARALRI